MATNDPAALQRSSISTGSNEMPKLSELTSVIREGLLALATLYDRDVNPAWTPLWLESLKDLPTEIVARAFVEIGKTFVPTAASPFPSPAHLRNLVSKANEKTPLLKADAEWQKLLDWLRLHFNPDIGVSRRAPQLDPVVLRAAKAAGGLHRIWGCPESDLQWAKKDFVFYFTSVHETGQNEFLLTDAEAKKLLADIRRGGPAGPPKLLPSEAQSDKPTRKQSEPQAPEKPLVVAPVRKHLAAKPLEQQLAEMRERGWIE